MTRTSETGCNNNKKGFTLIEILVVIVLISITSSLIFINFNSVVSVTKNQSTFTNAIDSAIVMINASTQFADGGEFGLGGEIGIATGKFHARGPVGVDQLTSFKYIVTGDGQIRDWLNIYVESSSFT